MKISRTLTVFATVAVLVCGAAVAVNASTTTTTPVTLCSHALTRLVTAPKDGTCPRSATTLKVASAAEITALRSENAELRTEIEQQNASIEALEAENAKQADAVESLLGRVVRFNVVASGSGWRYGTGASDLMPNSQISIYNGDGQLVGSARVSSEGSREGRPSVDVPCGSKLPYATATDRWGNSIISRMPPHQVEAICGT